MGMQGIRVVMLGMQGINVGMMGMRGVRVGMRGMREIRGRNAGNQGGNAGNKLKWKKQNESL